MSTPSPASTLPPPPAAAVAARTVDAAKIYGKGESEVRALDGVTVQFSRGVSPPSWAPRARASPR